jgi:hypothetical protein
MKAKSKSLPLHAIRLQTYSDLEQYARAFAQGHLNLLIICGSAGLGKSKSIRDAVGAQAFCIDGNASPFGIYLAAYEHRGQPLILDDVDGLYRDRTGVRLLKTLCQTDRIKSLSWETNATALLRNGIPRHFTTTSRVVMIANHWQSVSADVAALEDRGHFLLFEPTALEVHRRAGTWFWDQQIYDYVGDHLHLMAQHSLRTYVLAWELRKAGLDWRRSVLSRCLSGTALEVARLKADSSYADEAARVQAFVASGAGCRATYFNHAGKLRPAEARTEIQLTHSEPPPDTQPTDRVHVLVRPR